MSRSTTSNDANILLEMHMQELGIPFVPEYQFALPRKWAFDYLLWEFLAVEIEGGAWVGGRHVRPRGFEADMEKYNEAAIRGYMLVRFTPAMVLDGRARDLLLRYIDAELQSRAHITSLLRGVSHATH